MYVLTFQNSSIADLGFFVANYIKILPTIKSLNKILVSRLTFLSGMSEQF